MTRSRIHVGTSGWTYDDWDGVFYPEGVAGPERLAYYATVFDTVEVNATFYRLPFAGMIAGWNRRLPAGFHLVLKGPRAVTHLRKLQNCDEELLRFFRRVRPLQALRAILWQLPPSLHMDPERLDQFLASLPRDWRHSVEFRHGSWWCEKTAEILRRHGAAFVAISHPRLPADLVPTADFLYLRFHGLGPRLYDYDYSDVELRQWVERVRPHCRGRVLYAFFNNDWRAQAPRNALRLRELLGS